MSPALYSHLDLLLHQHTLWHVTSGIVHFELFTEWVEEDIWQGLNSVYDVEELYQIIVAVGEQEFRKRHRVDLHGVYLSHLPYAL